MIWPFYSPTTPKGIIEQIVYPSVEQLEQLPPYNIDPALITNMCSLPNLIMPGKDGLINRLPISLLSLWEDQDPGKFPFGLLKPCIETLKVRNRFKLLSNKGQS